MTNYEKEISIMAKKRSIKVISQSGHNYKATPTIMLKGQWLKKLGFDIGDYVSITCENGKLVITPDAERAAIAEAEADFMEREIESLKKAKAHYAKLKFEIYDDYTRTNITREQMAKKTAEVKNKIAELDRMIAEKQELLDLQKDLFVDAKQEQLTKLSKLDKFDEDVIRNIIDYVLIYDNEHIEIKWNFDDFHIE